MATKKTHPPKKGYKVNIIALIIAAVSLAGACIGSVYVWEKMGHVELGFHGALAAITN